MSKFFVYLSGKAGALALLLAFQTLAVTLLSAAAYSTYAVAFAVAAVAAVLGSLGAQRVLPTYVSRARSPEFASQASRVVRQLLLYQFIAVGIASLLCLFVTSSALLYEVRIGGEFALPVIALSFTTTFYSDAETVSQSLGQQRLSRQVALFEPAIRILLMLALHSLDALDERSLILLIVVTQAVATCVLFLSSFRRLERDARVAEISAILPSKEVIQLAAAGYFSGLAFLASSPAVVRIVAAAFLPASTLAVFSFCQVLATSLLKYSPGFVLFPFVEPVLLSSTAAESEKSRDMRSALSLMGKLDLLCMGLAAVSVKFGGGLVEKVIQVPFNKIQVSEVELIVPTLLLLIPIGTLYRSLEVKSSYSNRALPLYAGLVTSPLMLITMIFGGPYFGLLGLLFIPIFEGLLRLSIVDRLIKVFTGHSIIDWRLVMAIFFYSTGWIIFTTYSNVIFADREYIYSIGIVGFGATVYLVRLLTSDEANLIRRTFNVQMFTGTIDRLTRKR